MKERPILFSAPMVRAVLAGTKTQTRRIMARQKQHDFTDYTLFGQHGHPDDEAVRRGGWAEPWVAVEHAPDWPDGKEDRCPCPYASQRGDRLWVREAFAFTMEDGRVGPRPDSIIYRADDNTGWTGKWRPSIHMPRAASRITLEVTSVRVQRLWEISDADVLAEGCAGTILSYAKLWEQINGKGSWDANPWVWVIEFRRLP